MGQGGPKTQSGKAASSRNALRHGLLSDAPLTTRHETQEDWDAHLQAVVAALQPQDHLQTCLAERVAHLHWRLRRVGIAEVEMLEYETLCIRQEQARHPNSSTHTRTDGMSLVRSMNVLERLTRYEAHLGRELARIMKALHDLQSRPAPAAEAPAKTENCETNSTPSTPRASEAPSGPAPLPAANPHLSAPPYHPAAPEAPVRGGALYRSAGAQPGGTSPNQAAALDVATPPIGFGCRCAYGSAPYGAARHTEARGLSPAALDVAAPPLEFGRRCAYGSAPFSGRLAPVPLP